MGQVTELPLNSGLDQGVDRILLGSDKLALAQNCRLSRDGRLEVRPSFTALSSATYSTAALTAYDVTNYAGRLVALGDQCAQSRPTDLFEWNAARSKWRATSGDDTSLASGVRLPQLTSLKAMGMLPDQPESIFTAGLAAGAGYICVVNERRSATSSVVHVFDPTTNQSILIETLAVRRPQVVFAGTKFFIVGVNASENIVSTEFDPLVDETLPVVTARATSGGTVSDLAAKPCGTGWVLAYSTGTTCVAFRYNSTGVQQATWTAFASNTASVALACNAAGSLISVARQTTGRLYELSTFNASGVLQNGPTSLFGGGGGSGTRLGMELDAAGSLAIVGEDELNVKALYQEVVQSSHAAGTTRNYFDARPEGAPVLCNGKVYLGFTDLNATNFTKGTYHVVEKGNFLPQCFVGNQLCDTATTTTNTLSYMAALGTKLYFVLITVGIDNGTFTGLKYRSAVYEAETSGTDRRQFAQVGGELLISGGLPLTYDGRTLAEQGFAERPVALGADAAGGSLTLLGVYRGIPVWEVYDARGRLLRSQAGDPTTVTLTGANRSITWTVTTPHSLRRHPAFNDQALTIRVSLYRTEAGEGVFFLDSQVSIALTDTVAQPVTISSTASDASLLDNLILYEQSQTPLSHVSPPPYRFVHPTRERALAGGLPEGEAWQESKLLFPGEPVEWSTQGRLGFAGRVGQDLTGVAGFETVGLAFTRQEIWQIPGRGPEHNGTGEFDASVPIASPGGCQDWRSILVTPAGCFFQMRPDMLMLLTRGGDVQWIGLPVQDTLALFPTIVGAVFVRAADQVVFACVNSAGTDSVFLVYDLAVQQWFVDTVGAAVASVSELGGRLVYVSGGTVFQQDAAIASGVGALPTISIRTGSLRPFTALGYGDIVKLSILGTYLGDSTVDVQISYDDGQNWTSLGAQAVTTAAWTNAAGTAVVSGDPITLVYAPNIRTVDRFSLRVDISNSVNTGGLRLHVVSFEVEAQEGTTRRPARDQR